MTYAYSHNDTCIMTYTTKDILTQTYKYLHRHIDTEMRLHTLTYTFTKTYTNTHTNTHTNIHTITHDNATQTHTK